ncbi:hypothetical protein KL918_002436 [Ogataea parapolymorpha]|nr:hypothetical protein KL918_002436 [Ogataea parapolymorpha]KAG7870720.1 hypothetical protein KL916_004768 [Ogataea parapolymorpha]
MKYIQLVLCLAWWSLALANTETLQFVPVHGDNSHATAPDDVQPLQLGLNVLSVSLDPLTHVAPSENGQQVQLRLATNDLRPTPHFAKLCWSATAPVNVDLRQIDAAVLITVVPDYYSTNAEQSRRYLKDVRLEMHVSEVHVLPTDLWPILGYVVSGQPDLLQYSQDAPAGTTTQPQLPSLQKNPGSLMGQHQSQPLYYPSSTSHLREDHKKLPPIEMAGADSKYIANLFPFAQHSSSQQGASESGSSNPATQQDNPLFTLANSVPYQSIPGGKAQKEDENSIDWSRKAADIALRIDGAKQGMVESSNGGLPSPPGKYGGQGSRKQPRTFACPFSGCGKTFSRKMNLNSHIQSTHEHRKPFQCDKCKQFFARHSDRRRHETNQHKNDGGFVCGGVLKNGEEWGCGKSFKRKDGLTAHWRSQKAKKKCLRHITNPSELEMMTMAK